MYNRLFKTLISTINVNFRDIKGQRLALNQNRQIFKGLDRIVYVLKETLAVLRIYVLLNALI